MLYFVGYQDDSTDHRAPSISGESGREVYSLAGYAVLLALSSTYFLLSALTLLYLRGPDDAAPAQPQQHHGEGQLHCNSESSSNKQVI